MFIVHVCKVHDRLTDNTAVVCENGVCVWHTLQTTSCNWILSGGERKCGGTFTNSCVLCMEVVQVIGALLDAGFRELWLQEVETWSCMIECCPGVLPQPPAQTCCSTLMALFMRIGASQVGNWPYSFQSAMKVQWQSLMLWDIQRYMQDGSSKSHNQAQTSKESHLFWIVGVLMLGGGGFPRSSHLGSPLWAEDEKAVNGVASSTVTKRMKVQDNSFHRKGHDHRLLGH